jgi:YggT family protein
MVDFVVRSPRPWQTKPGAPPSHEVHVLSILFQIASEILNLYKWAVIIAAVMSMLVSFNVLDTRNRLVWTIGDFLYRITEPALAPIRRVMPSFGNIDLSPIALIFLIYVAQMLLARIYAAIAFGNVSGLIF